MKFLKFLVVCAVSTVAMSAAAASTAQATIKITADDSEFADAINLYQDAQSIVKTSDVRNSFNSNYDVQMYVVDGSDNYSSYTAADLNGVTVKFEANPEETAYTMSFSGVVGDMTLVAGAKEYKVSNDSVYSLTVAASGELTFTVSVAQPSTYVRDNLTVGQYGTICYPGAVSKIEGGEVYELTSATATEVRGEQVATTEAGKSYVFKATATSLVLTYDPTTEIANPATTLGMVGNFGPAEISVPTGMFGINGTSVMEVAAGTMLKANRAYINLAELQAVPGAPGRRLFDVVGEVTALDAVKAEAGKVQKVMINGQMVIIRDGKMFNAQGAAL